MITRKEIYFRLVRAYYKTRKNIRSSTSQLEFEIDLEHNLFTLALDVYARKYTFSQAVRFIAHERVAREVCAPHFRDRVVSVMLSEILLLVYEPCFITDSYACRKGKGVLYGVQRMAKHLRSATRNFTQIAYAIKLDFEGFFLHISHPLLDKIITDKFTSRKTIAKWGKSIDLTFFLWLSRLFIYRDLLKNSISLSSAEEERLIPANKLLKNHPERCGLIPGDCSGQIFANILADRQDQFVKRSLHVKHYGRYMDDAILFVTGTKEEASEILSSLSQFASSNLLLSLHKKKSKVTQYSNLGIPFLGVRLIYYRMTPIRYIYTAIKQAGSKQESLNSYKGYLSHYSYNRHLLFAI